MLDRRKHKDLISAYFKLTSIDFIPNVLDELEITKEFRIEKPSSDLDMYYKFLKQSRYQAPSKTRSSGLEKLKGFSKPISGAKLTRVNHGH
jgi:hypothetical protein